MKLTDKQKIGTLAGMLLFVIQGLRKGSVKSKPIMNIDDKAESYDTTSLEEEIWKALNKCGIKEAVPAQKRRDARAKMEEQP